MAERTAAAAADPVLVIDPGHGGADGGASSAEGLLESEVNWDIARRLLALCRLCGIRAVMTRQDEAPAYPPQADTIRKKKVWDQHQRAALAADTPGAVLLSIHQNAFVSPGPHGANVLYAAGEDSLRLAESVLAALTETALGVPGRSPIAAPETIYLLATAECPAVLAECGFLTNPDDAARLDDAGYRLQTACALFAGYLHYIGEDQ